MSNHDLKQQKTTKRRERLAAAEMAKRAEETPVQNLVAFPKQIVKDGWDQLLGVRQELQQTDQELMIQQETLKEENLRLKRQIAFERRKIHEQRVIGLRENEEVQIQIKELRQQLQEEIARLGKEAQLLSREALMISVEQAPQEGGVYHLNFFQWIIETIRIARKKVQDAATWLVVWQSKTAKQRGMLLGFKGNKGPKSFGAGVHMMIGSEMGSARSGA